MPKLRTKPVAGTRAVERRIEAGCEFYCASCDVRVKFTARQIGHMVLCNVYEKTEQGPEWNRLEVFHSDCYEEAGQPHGMLQERPARVPKQQSDFK